MSPAALDIVLLEPHEAALRSLLLGAGFATVRRATETPFNMVLEARP